LGNVLNMAEFPVPQIAQVVIDTTNPRLSAEFWKSLLGLFYRSGHEPPAPDLDDPAGRDWLNLLTATGQPCLAFQMVDTLSVSTWPDPQVPQQLHLDLTVRDINALHGAHARVLELGGQLLFDRSDSVEEPLKVYGDPDGHPFCPEN
jgi:Glyoxalase-like domain